MTSNVPEGAQLSEDKNYWWDGAAWQLVEPQGYAGQGAADQHTEQYAGQDTAQYAGQAENYAGDAGQDAGGGAANPGTAAFALGGHGVIAQLGVSDEEGDPQPAANRDTKVSFTVVNMGSADGVATVHIYVDDQEVQGSPWTSPTIAAGQSAQPDDTFFHHCGSYPAGHHTFKATVEPAATGPDDAVTVVNDVDLADVG